MTSILIAVTVTAVLLFIFNAANKEKLTKTYHGEYVLCYSNIIKWFCMGIVFIGLVGLTFMIATQSLEREGDVAAVIFMYSGLSLFGIYFYIEFFTVKIIISESGIKGTSGWRGTRIYNWQDIEEITYSPSSMWFKITSSKAASLRIHALISGIDTFQRLYEENLPKEKWSSANEKFGRDKRVSK